MEKDVTQNVYFMDPRRFADLVNGYVGHGKQLLLPQNLESMDARSGMYRISDFGGKGDSGKQGEDGKKPKNRIRYRDVKKKAVFGKHCLVIGIENQETVDYALPVRVMSSDTGEYGRQLSLIRKRIRNRRSKKGLRPGEYLYGFRKSSRLYGAVTFVIYYGEEEWDGSKDLCGLLDLADIPAELRKLIGNYGVNLIEVRRLEDTSVFQTDIRQVFDFIRCSNDAEKLRELVENDSEFRHLAEDAYDVIVQYANAPELLEQKENSTGKDGKVDMCKALKELIANGEARGEARGEVRGEARGEARMNELFANLIRENRFDDMKKVVSDSAYRSRLLAEYHISGAAQ